MKTEYGQFILLTRPGEILAADSIDGDGEWLMLKSGGVETSLYRDDLVKAYRVKQDGPLAGVANSAQLGAGILRVEALVKEFKETHPSGGRPLELVLFGAASLALTILPSTTTQDLDMVAPGQFIEFLRNKKNQTNLDIEVLNPYILFYIGSWRERSCRLIGYHQTEIQVLHPLDTVAQKLLRIDREKFDIKDKPDINQVINLLRPNETTLLQILTENPARYRLADDSELDALERNTAWFTSEHLPNWDFARLKAESQKRRSEMMRRDGIKPLKDIDMGTGLGLDPINPHDLGTP